MRDVAASGRQLLIAHVARPTGFELLFPSCDLASQPGNLDKHSMPPVMDQLHGLDASVILKT